MSVPSRSKRKRFFIAVEGESEQSFVRWLQLLLTEKNLPVHLDTHPLGGGGFESMLRKALQANSRGRIKGTYVAQFLIVDEDRANNGDWPLTKLRAEATGYNISLIVQRTNHEALLYRLISGRVNDVLSANRVQSALRHYWLDYEKPATANQLRTRLDLKKLQQVAAIDNDLTTLLQGIGLLT